jgi:hypothetical protein
LQHAGYNRGFWNISDEPCKVKQITGSFVGLVGFVESVGSVGFVEFFEFIGSIEFGGTRSDAGYRIQDTG